MKDRDLTRESLEKQKRCLFKRYHPDTYPGDKNEAHFKFLSVGAAYYSILKIKEWEVPSTTTASQSGQLIITL